MTLLGSGSPWDRPVQLHDGTMVSSYSDLWRQECEAREILAMASKAERQAYLERVELRRGRAATDRLRAVVMKVWEARRESAQ